MKGKELTDIQARNDIRADINCKSQLKDIGRKKFMKINYLKQKKELIPLVMLGASAVLAGLILMKTTSFFTSLARAESIVQKATAQNNVDENDADKYLAKYKVLADALKKNNLFAPAPPRQHPVKEVSGIFGNEVLIRDKWYKVGDNVGDAKIVAIEPTQAIIEWDGVKKAFLPFDAGVSEAPMRSGSGKAVVKAGKADMVVISSGRESMSDREGKDRWEKQSRKGGEKQGGRADWTRKMSLNDLRGVREKIEEHLRGMRAKGVTDPAEYDGAKGKLQAVEDAMWERGGSK